MDTLIGYFKVRFLFAMYMYALYVRWQALSSSGGNEDCFISLLNVTFQIRLNAVF